LRAIVQSEYGDPAAVLRLEDVEVPEPGDGAVRVRVHAAGVSKGDWHLVTGIPYVVRLAFGLRRPRHRIPGQEVAGAVEAVGKDVKRLQPGDEVFGEIPSGAFAEHACTPESLLVSMPSDVLSFAEAAAVPAGALTALQGLRDAAKLEAGQRVLINGASGGVGTFAVQIAKALGATVTAVRSTGKVDAVRALGADHVIDYTRDDFAFGETRYDAMFDLVGNRPLADCRRALDRAGVYVAAAGGGGRWISPMPRFLRMKLVSPFVSQRLTGFFVTPDRSDLDAIRELVEGGAVRPLVTARRPLEDVPDAVREIGEGHALGKTVITVLDD
jgi:NADPH:quinone reductase-like Zn-dependent oxidoreductase